MGQPLPEELLNSPDDLVALLHVAHRLQFTQVLDVASKEAGSRIPASRRLGLALECGLDDAARSAFEHVVLSFDNDILDPEGFITGETLLKVFPPLHLLSTFFPPDRSISR